MMIIYDKNIDTNIVEMTFGDKPIDRIYWSHHSFNSMTCNTETFTIYFPHEDTMVKFNSYESMIPYINQYLILDPTHVYPGVNGIMTNPYHDKPKTGDIISHSYTLTDVEKGIL